MGIPGLYDHVGKLERVALAKLAAEHFSEHGRKLRLAIDASIWLFQAKASLGGSNPVLRTIYFRLLRLLKLGIDPIFVFDGPHRPTDKRNKKINASFESRHAKHLRTLLDCFGFVHHNAPGEAEAECAFLQREGYVDMVFSEDGDTLMFGATVTIRNWSSQEKRGPKAPTHVDIIHSKKIKAQQRLSREGMVLIALMSGGDYDTVGIKGCGPTIAYEAAKAGFGDDLCQRSSHTREWIEAWRERLRNELRENKSGFFSRRHPKVADTIGTSFPSMRIVESYMLPLDSSLADISELKQSIEAERPVAIPRLREFLGARLEWNTRAGAFKFIRGLAPALLTCQLLTTTKAMGPPKGLISVCGARMHHSSDGIPESKVEIKPIDVVPIDLSLEPLPKSSTDPPQSSQPITLLESDDDEVQQETEEADDIPATPSKSRQYRPYDPSANEKFFIAECYVRHGAMGMIDEWLVSSQLPKPKSPRKPRVKKPLRGTGMQEGAIEAFFQVSKSNVVRSQQLEIVQNPISKPPNTTKRTKTAPARVNEFHMSVNPWTRAKTATKQATLDLTNAIEDHAFSPTSQLEANKHTAANSRFKELSDRENVPDYCEVDDLDEWTPDDISALMDTQKTDVETNTSFSSMQFSERLSSQELLDAEIEALSQQAPQMHDFSKLNSRLRDSLPGAWTVESPGGSRRTASALRGTDVVDLT